MTTIMAFPMRGDSYTECLNPALAAEGVTVREGKIAGRWLLENLRGVDYIHFHWMYFFTGAPQRRAALRGFALFLFFIALARWRGTRVIWTVHNLYPHDRCVIPALDRLGRWVLVRMASRFFIHGWSAEAEVLREFPAMTGRTTLIDHGNWIGFYPNTITRNEARAKLSLDDNAFVFLFIGLGKPYKNLEGLLAAFAQLPDRATLVIAGRFPDLNYQARITAAIERSQSRTRIKLFPEWLPSGEIQVFLNAADVIVAPYVEVLTSGTAMLALSFGRPVVAPARGFLKDAITKDCGVLYEPDTSDGLRDALLNAMRLQFNEPSVMKEAERHQWSKAARAIVASLRSG